MSGFAAPLAKAKSISRVLPSMDVTRLTAVVVWEDGIYVAHCPEAGTASQGRTVEEAVANLKEATELYLEDADARILAERPPVVTSFEVDVAAGA